MADEPTTEPDEVPWPQRVLDNLWLMLALSIAIPGLLYLTWGLIELAVLPTWGAGNPGH